MPETKACYRELTSYKYQLMEDYVQEIPIKPDEDIDLPYIKLTKDGVLTVADRYAWDGPSGITIDTRNFMRGSLVHDALYQLMREKALDYRVHRDPADRLLQSICKEDGMSSFRAWYVYKAVAWFGEKHAKPPATPQADAELIYAP